MSNQINEKIEEHYCSCESDEEVIDTGNSFICPTCDEVIVDYF